MTKLFITLGPSTLNKEFLKSLEPRYIKLLRINLSHTEINDLPKIVNFIRKYTNINICFDTEGAQIRTSKIKNKTKLLKKNGYIYINKDYKQNNNIVLTPKDIYKKLKINDNLYIDFNSAQIKIISETSKTFKCK